MHSLDICREIAERMKNPEKIYEIILNAISQKSFSDIQWEDTTLSEGLPGIACFYAAMNEAFPTDGWEKIAHDYLKFAISDFDRGKYSHHSFHLGLCGLCFAVYTCSQQGKHYQNLLTKLETILVEKTEKTLSEEAKHLLYNEWSVPPGFYNLAIGFSGVLAYLLLRKNEPRLIRLATELTEYLVRLLNKKRKDSFPNWHVSAEHQLAEEEKVKYPEGNYFLNMPYGILGCLSALSLALLNHIKVSNLEETIKCIASWITASRKMSSHGICWPNTISPITSEGQSDLNVFEINRDSWWCGIPAVARSLYLASQAIKEPSLASFSEESYSSMFAKPPKEWNLMGTSFVHGRAGVLATTYRMAQDTNNPLLWKQVNLLEEDLKSFYKPNSLFGFQMVHVNHLNQYQWVDHPGLCRGAAGIALSLLLVQDREKTKWDRAFLIC